ncbi:MAG: deoxyribonuclease V [Ardenticatenaceae bacterium]|nr:deoxyribonuclease V [Ardenticatenaceae bacterium]HBY99085.1 deoxyribonuclease V [Chloroflexota bacterium]
MSNTFPIRWDLTPKEAIAFQQELRARLILEDDFRGPVALVGGVDMSLRDEAATAAIAVFSFPTLEPRAEAVAQVPLTFPYIPGLLAFREGPAIEAAWQRLSAGKLPDLLMFDGHGIAHPRGLGIASQMGLLLDRPSIGVAKSILVGRHEPVPDVDGAWQPLIYRGKVVGAALRLRPGVKPIYVSAGHRISLSSAIEFVGATGRGHKLPEPTRWAHKLAGGGHLPGVPKGQGADSSA